MEKPRKDFLVLIYFEIFNKLIQTNIPELLQKYFPDKIRDVFFVGHCLFGCQSCGIREHQIPVYFSRYFNHQLPYSRADIEKQLNKLRKKPKRDNLPNSVLICPSGNFTIYSLTFLNLKICLISGCIKLFI